ncbi:MAG: hypothetical protein NTX01_02950 [Candidatus Omnitrophica bacterium]|nr:hypothetical protein [Candidatus Omnitrophota bacterium]
MKDIFSKKEQIKKWSELYGRQISEEEYEKISRNLGGFFGLLDEWKKKKAQKKKREP